MTEQTQAAPSMMEAFRGVWDTCPMFKELRQHAPVLHIPEIDAWILSRYDDVITVVRDSERFGAMPADLVGEVPDELKESLPHGYAPWQPALVNTDPPEHDRIRKLAAKPLTPAAVGKREGQIREAATGLIEPLIPLGRADLVDRFATPMPVQVLIKILGVSPEDYKQFHQWTLGITELFVPTISEERRLELAREQVAFNEYLTEAIAARRKSPGDDLISGLILAQERNEKSLTDREVLGIVGQLVIAGFETSAGAISFSLYKLCEQPDLLARVRDDVTLIPKVVEESLRRLTPARGVVRRVKEDVEFHGQTIPAGANIFALVQSANNDESKFSCPERFDIDRDAQEMRNSMHFGGGVHACIGQSVARLDARIAIETAITRLPNLRVAPGQQIQVQDGMIFHRPEKLEFEWDV
ncbi:cytochrome P450 [Nocardia jinanensis]|uniref:Cytochrome P450 n=1 Tax=Nocardia jinanensis TaxID=382504 RepID=A0A917RIK3_9NOCA|nr:cytochrome P450 [Nocardia jinanensis]GGL10157.1 cytochrome P450 [Nocardia jinanensis]